MNTMREEAAHYLMIRRALGFRLRGHDRLLEDFLVFLERTGGSTITTEAALAWATAPAEVSPIRWAQRLCAVRGFARHLHGIDPTVEVPPVDLLAYRRQRPTPYLYTERDIARLVAAATSLRPTLRAATYQTFFGLLASTGLLSGGQARHRPCGSAFMQVKGVHRRNDVHDGCSARQAPPASTETNALQTGSKRRPASRGESNADVHDTPREVMHEGAIKGCMQRHATPLGPPEKACEWVRPFISIAPTSISTPGCWTSTTRSSVNTAGCRCIGPRWRP